MTRGPLPRLALAVVLAVLSVDALAYCYVLHDKGNRVVYQSSTAPVDVSGSISEAVERAYPGHFLVIGEDAGECPEVNEIAQAPPVKLPDYTPTVRRPITIGGDYGGSEDVGGGVGRGVGKSLYSGSVNRTISGGTTTGTSGTSGTSGTVSSIRPSVNGNAYSGSLRRETPTARAGPRFGQHGSVQATKRCDPGVGVAVHSYTRKDGTVVRAHSRRCPRH